MPDLGYSLLDLKVEHPEVEAVCKYLVSTFEDPRVAVEVGPQVRLMAHIATPHGVRTLA